MAVSIRLRRMGRKKQPHYRVVVAESEHPRDGRFVESLGFYKPLSDPARLVLDLERVDYWMGRGAQPSETVRSLIGKARRGGDDSLILGEADVQVEKAKRAEMLAERRAAEKRKAEAETKAQADAKKAQAQAEAAPTEVPQDEAESPEGSSAEDATAAEAMAEGEAEAAAVAEDAAPNAPAEESMKKSSAGEKKAKKKDAGAEEG